MYLQCTWMHLKEFAHWQDGRIRTCDHAHFWLQSAWSCLVAVGMDTSGLAMVRWEPVEAHNKGHVLAERKRCILECIELLMWLRPWCATLNDFHTDGTIAASTTVCLVLECDSPMCITAFMLVQSQDACCICIAQCSNIHLQPFKSSQASHICNPPTSAS